MTNGCFDESNRQPLIIINESMQFSAGVNLNYVMDFKKGDLIS